MKQRAEWSLAERMQFQISIWNPKWLFAWQAFMYRHTGGRMMGSVRGIPVLLLTTTGRKTGRKRTRALMYLQDGNAYVVCASNAGLDRPPGWWVNLRHDPRATVQVGPRRFGAVAERVPAAERPRLWHAFSQMNPFYPEYQKRTSREMDLVILRPDGS